MTTEPARPVCGTRHPEIVGYAPCALEPDHRTVAGDIVHLTIHGDLTYVWGEAQR